MNQTQIRLNWTEPDPTGPKHTKSDPIRPNQIQLDPTRPNLIEPDPFFTNKRLILKRHKSCENINY